MSGTQPDEPTGRYLKDGWCWRLMRDDEYGAGGEVKGRLRERRVAVVLLKQSSPRPPSTPDETYADDISTSLVHFRTCFEIVLLPKLAIGIEIEQAAQVEPQSCHYAPGE